MLTKINPIEFSRIKKLNSLLSLWVKNMKTDKIWLCKSVVKINRIGNQGEDKMNEINIHNIANL